MKECCLIQDSNTDTHWQQETSPKALATLEKYTLDEQSRAQKVKIKNKTNKIKLKIKLFSKNSRMGGQ